MAKNPVRRPRAKSPASAVPAKDWTLTILVPAAKGEEDQVRRGQQTDLHATELHTKGFIGWVFGGEEQPVKASDVAGQWKETISGIVSTVGEWTKAQADQWQVDEVTFGLTLSAKGRLMFIAEASAQGSVQVKLKRVR